MRNLSQSNVGGEKLRYLRRERYDHEGKRLTIEKVAEAAGFNYRTLADIERGVAKRPPLETIQRILKTLAQFAPIPVKEKNIVFNAYAYQPIFDTPSAREVEQACQLWQEQYQNLRLPAYLVTFSQQLLTWNRYAPLILGVNYGSKELEKLRGVTIFDLAFNTDFIASSRIVNGETFFPDMLRVIKAEMQLFRYEEWYQMLISETKNNYPVFESIWDSLPEVLPSVAVRTFEPVQIQHPSGKILKFQLMGVDFADDPRFRSVQYHAVDAVTLNEWNLWIEAEGIQSQ